MLETSARSSSIDALTASPLFEAGIGIAYGRVGTDFAACASGVFFGGGGVCGRVLVGVPSADKGRWTGEQDGEEEEVEGGEVHDRGGMCCGLTFDIGKK